MAMPLWKPSRASTSSASARRTHITADVLEHAERLIAIGCFSVGTNQVDIDAVRQHGISVLQRPLLQHPLGGGIGDRRDRDAAAAHP